MNSWDNWFYPRNRTQPWEDRVMRKLDAILKTQEAILATLDDVLKDVTDEGTRLDSLSALITGLQQQVKDALANSGISAADQAKVDAIFAQAESNKAKVDAALNAGVPSA